MKLTFVLLKSSSGRTSRAMGFVGCCTLFSFGGGSVFLQGATKPKAPGTLLPSYSKHTTKHNFSFNFARGEFSPGRCNRGGPYICQPKKPKGFITISGSAPFMITLRCQPKRTLSYILTERNDSSGNDIIIQEGIAAPNDSDGEWGCEISNADRSRLLLNVEISRSSR